jgi:hypothetical protein
LAKWQLQGLFNQRAYDLDRREFMSTMLYLRQERQYLMWNRKKALRTLVGPPAYDGPVYDGQSYSGQVINGRIYNGICHLHYSCIRGMSDEYFYETLARLHFVAGRLRTFPPVNLPN